MYFKTLHTRLITTLTTLAIKVRQCGSIFISSQALGNPNQQMTIFSVSPRPSWNFNRGEHVIATFLDVEKAFDNVWHNGLWYKIYQLDLCRWLSDFLVGRVIQVKIEGFLSPKVYPKAGVPQGSNLSPLLFLILCQ